MHNQTRAIILFLVTLLAALGAQRVEPVVDFVDTVPDHAGLEPYRHLLAELDGTRFVVLYMPHDASLGPDLRTDEGFDALVDEQAELEAQLSRQFDSEITHYLSAHAAMEGGNYMFWKFATGGNPPANSYSVPSDPATYDQVRARVLEDADSFLAKDGSSTLALAFIASKDDKTARALSADITDAVATWHADRAPLITGTPQTSGLLVTSQETDERTATDIAFWGTIAAVCVALTLWFVLRRPTHALAAVGSLGVATVWTFGVIGWAGIPVSFLTVFLAPVVMGIGIDHAIHLLHTYQRAQEQGLARPMREAIRALRGPLVVATTTTASVLALMALVPARLFSQLGWISAIGVAFGLIAAVMVTPLARNASKVQRPDRMGEAVAKMASAIARRRTLALGITLLLVAGLALAATQTRIESGSAENEFPQDDPQIVLQHRIEAEYGVLERAYLIVEGDIANPNVLRALDQGVLRSSTLPLWKDATSIVDILRADAATDEGVLEPIGTSGTPNTRGEAKQRIAGLFEDPFWRTIAPFLVSRDQSLAVVAITLEPWDSQEQLRDLADALTKLAEQVDEIAGTAATVNAGGRPLNRAAIVEDTPNHIMLVAGAGSLVVVATLSLFWVPRRGLEGLRAAVIGGVLVAAATVVLIGFIPILDQGYAWLAASGAPSNSIALNDMFLLAFAITVGLGVDDFVHIITRAWRARDAGSPNPLHQAWTEAGRSITGTTLTTLAAFVPLTGLYFLQSKNLAILVSLGVATVWLLTLVAAPWAIRRPRVRD